MWKSKFVRLIATLSKDEITSFAKHLKRLHCNDGIAIAVFDYIRKLHPFLPNEAKLDINYAYKKIFKEPLEGDKANRSKLLNALSDLHLWLKEFLMLEKIKLDTFESNTFWMSILKERGLNEEFSRKASMIQKRVEKMPKSSIEDYMKGMTANYLFYYHLTYDKQKVDIQALSNCGSDLDLFYAVSRLKIACEMANRQNLMSQPPNLEVLPAIIELSKANQISDHPLLALYLKVYELISNQHDVHYPVIESMLKEHFDKIAPDEIHTILSYLHNHLAFRIRGGDEGYVALTHSLNKFASEYNVLAVSGEMSSSQFTNIVNVAASENDLGWAYSFIEQYNHLLPLNVRKGSVCLAEAILLYEKNDYDGVLMKLRELSFPDLHFAIRTKSLILRSLYELNRKDFAVVDFCLSFEAYLKRYRKPKREAVEGTLNFIGFVKKLAKRNVPKESIINGIQNTDPVYFRKWLLEKACLYEK